MTRQTFILILCIYGFLLGFIMILIPEFAVSSYAGNPANVHETSTMRFFGALHLGFNFTGLAIRNSADTNVVRAYLLGTARPVKLKPKCNAPKNRIVEVSWTFAGLPA